MGTSLIAPTPATQSGGLPRVRLRWGSCRPATPGANRTPLQIDLVALVAAGVAAYEADFTSMLARFHAATACGRPALTEAEVSGPLRCSVTEDTS